jgi:hypothetical protein
MKARPSKLVWGLFTLALGGLVVLGLFALHGWPWDRTPRTPGGDPPGQKAERDANAVVLEVEPLIESDPAQALARLQQAAREFAARGEYPGAQERLLAGRRRAVLARLEAARKEALLLVDQKKDQPDCFQAAAALATRLRVELGEEARVVGVDVELEDFVKSYRYLEALESSANQPEPDR